MSSRLSNLYLRDSADSNFVFGGCGWISWRSV